MDVRENAQTQRTTSVVPESYTRSQVSDHGKPRYTHGELRLLFALFGYPLIPYNDTLQCITIHDTIHEEEGFCE